MRAKYPHARGLLALLFILVSLLTNGQNVYAQVMNDQLASISAYDHADSPAVSSFDAVSDPEAVEAELAKQRAEQQSKKLAKAGWFSALKRKTVGYCLAGVQDAMDAVGLNVTRKAAAADLAPVLASDERFEEIAIPKQELTDLPPGNIIIWNRSEKHPYGHISITLGNGAESSDHIQKIRPDMTPSFRVFAVRG